MMIYQLFKLCRARMEIKMDEKQLESESLQLHIYTSFHCSTNVVSTELTLTIIY